MTDTAKQAYADWQNADAQARQAEIRLKAAWIAFDSGGSPPTAALLAEVSQLRAVANDRLTAAVAALDSAKSIQKGK